MSSLGHDPELPAGLQEADIEQAEFEQQAADIRALNRRGICNHGWLLGKAEVVNRPLAEIEHDHVTHGKFPKRPIDPRIQMQDDIPEGYLLCLDCGEIVVDHF